MKIMKSYWQWIFIIGIPLLLVSSIALYYPNIALQIFKLHWLAVLLLLIVLCSPKTDLRLAATDLEPPRYTRRSWLLQIVILQLSSMAVFLGICVCCGVSAPVNTHPHLGLFSQTMRENLVSLGLFPWGFIALTAVLIGEMAYRQKKDAYWTSILDSWISNPLITIGINFIGRMLIILIFGISICIMSLLWASMGTVFSIVTGFYLTSLLLATILFILSFTQIFRRNVVKAVGKEIPLAPGLFLWAIFLAAAIWLLNGFLEPWTHIAMSPPTLLSHWLNYDWGHLWRIFAYGFWLFWTPLLGMNLARISRGYQVKETIIAILALPLILGLVLYFTRHVRWDIAPIYAGLTGAAGLLILFLLTLRKKSIPTFILAYLPRQDHYKFRSYHRTFVRVAQWTITILFIYLPGGIYTLNFLVYPFVLCAILILLLCAAVFLQKFVVRIKLR